MAQIRDRTNRDFVIVAISALPKAKELAMFFSGQDNQDGQVVCFDGTPHVVYASMVDYLLRFGEKYEPRGHKCIRIPKTVFVRYTDPLKPFIHHPGRGFNVAFALVEVFTILGADPRVPVQARFNANVHRFSDNGEDFAGHYGVRINLSMQRIIDLLTRDPNTRQAVVPIFHPQDSLEAYRSKDIPCNIFLIFKVRNERLDMIVTRRSNDIFWGYATNVVQFSHLHAIVSGLTGIPVGFYHEVIHDLHAYMDNVDLENDAFYNIAKFQDILLSPGRDPHARDWMSVPDLKGTRWESLRNTFTEYCDDLLRADSFQGMKSTLTKSLDNFAKLSSCTSDEFAGKESYWYWSMSLPYIHLLIKDKRLDEAHKMICMTKTFVGNPMPECLCIMYRDYLSTYRSYAERVANVNLEDMFGKVQ